jgi:hypothetical protein
MADWSITHDPDKGVFRLRLPEELSTAVARAALTELVAQIVGSARSVILIADLRVVRRIEAAAPIVGAQIFSAAVSKTEHVYILTDRPLVRSAASAAASSIGLRFTCLKEEPDLTASHPSPRRSGS